MAGRVLKEGVFVLTKFGKDKHLYDGKKGVIERLFSKQADVKLLEGDAMNSVKRYPHDNLVEWTERSGTSGAAILAAPAGVKRVHEGSEIEGPQKSSKMSASDLANDIFGKRA